MATGSSENIAMSGAAWAAQYPNIVAAFKTDRVPVTAAMIPEYGGQLWANLIDDVVIALVDQTETNRTDIAAISGALVDTLGSPLVTGSASSGGGTVDFTIAVGAGRCRMDLLRVVANGGTTDSTVRLYRDSGRTDEIYAIENVDASTQYTDRNTCSLIGDDGSTLEANTLYGRVTNDGGSASTYGLEVVLGAF